jgi:hypothetical protein
MQQLCSQLKLWFGIAMLEPSSFFSTVLSIVQAAVSLSNGSHAYIYKKLIEIIHDEKSLFTLIFFTGASNRWKPFA